MEYYAGMDLQLFAEEGAAAPAAGGAETGTAAETGSGFTVGDQLADGSTVRDAQVAAALNRQVKRHPELRKVYSQPQAAAGAAQPAPAQPEPVQAQAAGAQAPDNTPNADERWAELKKGEYREQYARDVQNAIRDRFKNQEDANRKLNSMQPMLDALMKKSGAENLEELQKMVLDDDSLYEEEAEAMGMTVEGYKKYRQMQQEHEEMAAKEARIQQRQQNMQHIAGLHRQAEEMKQLFPGFDLQKEMQNEKFFQMTKPGGYSVKEAYYAVHGDELIPQLMSYGMQRAQQQMGQTLQAQRARPAEGAMNSRNQAAAEPKINPRNLSRKEREAYKQMVRKGKFVSFDN